MYGRRRHTFDKQFGTKFINKIMLCWHRGAATAANIGWYQCWRHRTVMVHDTHFEPGLRRLRLVESKKSPKRWGN